MRNRLFTVILIATAGGLALSTPAFAKASFKSSLDANGDGALSLEEFVMGMAERDHRRFDRDKNDMMSVAEWTASGGEWQLESARRFNADGDDVLSADELVAIYSFIFKNRDKDKDGKLSLSESPTFLIQE